MSATVPTNLVEQSFWDDEYFGDPDLPLRPDPGFSFDRSLVAALEQAAPARAEARVLEVGCAPGRWLLWYAERFGARPTGIEYSAKGARLTRDSFAAAGHEVEVREGDFFSSGVDGGAFDLVLSLGFIEHFDDLDVTFARHVEFLGPGGLLVVGVPNYRGALGALQRWADPAHLALHNREAMVPGRMEAMAHAGGLEVTDVRYLGGLDPALVKVSRHGPAAVLLPLTAYRRLRVADRINHRLLSAYRLLVARRPGVPGPPA